MYDKDQGGKAVVNKQGRELKSLYGQKQIKK